MDAKKYLIEMLDYYKHRILNDSCTMEEINSAAKTLQENMTVYGSIQDFAKFYDVSENSIRATISRKLITRPKRGVFYPFHKFIKVIPEKWRQK